jgi:hypothetical protein
MYSVQMYTKEDTQFEEIEIDEVATVKDGWNIRRADSFSFHVSKDSPIIPTKGMIARFYGKGIGFSIRGLFLNGEKVFYRTEKEDKEKQEIDMYGLDASDWLRKWDNGETVWTIEMGGLGPGYEQCIHIICAEILRHFLDKNYDHSKWVNKNEWEKVSKETDEIMISVPVVKKLGCSGAQWGAALSLAAYLFKKGPREMMNDSKVSKRHIQVSKIFPAY